MDTAHWSMAGMTALLMLTLWMIAAAFTPKNRAYRWARKVFWSFSLLWVSESLGWIGLNGVNLITTSFLGRPGYGALLTAL